MSRLVPYCAECDSPLNANGTCPKCRDSEDEQFVVDMESRYLAPAAPVRIADVLRRTPEDEE
jgi:hypothetical protein